MQIQKYQHKLELVALINLSVLHLSLKEAFKNSNSK